MVTELKVRNTVKLRRAYHSTLLFSVLASFFPPFHKFCFCLTTTFTTTPNAHYTHMRTHTHMHTHTHTHMHTHTRAHTHTHTHTPEVREKKNGEENSVIL